MNKLTKSLVHSIFVDNPNKNWIFCPASYLEAVSNLAECLNGQNLTELLEVAPDIKENQANGLDTFSTLLYSQEYHEALNEVVVQVLKERGTELESFDGPGVIDRVNTLVREKTHGKIHNLLSQNDIDEFTKFIVLNCVYFKKKWLYQFEENWREEEFHGANQTSSIKFLHHKIKAGSAKYFEDDKLDIAEIAYKDSDIAFYLIIPKNGLFELFNDIENTLKKIGLVKNGFALDVTIPSFNIESTFSKLAEQTKLAGVNNIFKWNQDWELIDIEKIHPNTVLKVQKIIQKTYLDFTKEGTEAAAATAIMFGLVSGCARFEEPLPIKYIRADKPFMYVLGNKSQLDKPLFIGVIYDIPNTIKTQPFI